jgi:DNA-binding NarL/FixJ family response regulator
MTEDAPVRVLVVDDQRLIRERHRVAARAAAGIAVVGTARTGATPWNAP